ncbi:MAG: hypothetical protein AB1898_32950 [Acidobacteriota bacterium]
MRVLLLLLVLMSMSTLGAERQQVVLRLFVPESTVCKGAKEVRVRLEVQNVGSAPVEIDLAALGSGFDAIALYSTESNAARFESFQVTGDKITRPKRRSQVLQPGATHALGGAIVLDESFFAEPGFYKIRTDYFDRREERRSTDRQRNTIHVSSNWVILQVEPCSARSKPQP